MKKHLIHMNSGRDARGMAEAIRDYMINKQKMDAQILRTDDGGCIVQGRSHNRFRTLVGMKKAIVARISPIGDCAVELKIGESQWIDKAIVTTVSMFILWPLTVTSAVGDVQQALLPGKLLEVAEMYAL